MGHFSGETDSDHDAEAERKSGRRGGRKEENVSRSRRRRVSTGTEKTAAGQLLGLSLFIMLLAFFIVLNAISSFEESKVSPVIQSLEYTFASKIRSRSQDTAQPSARQSSTTSTSEGDTLEQIEELFSAQIPNVENVVKNERLGMMYIQVPFEGFKDAVFGLEKAQPQDQGNAGAVTGRYFLPTLVGLLKSDRAGYTYRMDMILGTGRNPSVLASDKPQTLDDITKEMSRIARRIESAGIPQKLLSAGIQNRDENMIDLVFRPHIPFNPLGTDSNE